VLINELSVGRGRRIKVLYIRERWNSYIHYSNYYGFVDKKKTTIK